MNFAPTEDLNKLRELEEQLTAEKKKSAELVDLLKKQNEHLRMLNDQLSTEQSKNETLSNQLSAVQLEKQNLKLSLTNYQNNLESALGENEKQLKEQKLKNDRELQEKKNQLDREKIVWREQERSRLKDEVDKDNLDLMKALNQREQELDEREEDLQEAEKIAKSRQVVCRMGKIIDGFINAIIDIILFVVLLAPAFVVIDIGVRFAFWLYDEQILKIWQFILSCAGILFFLVASAFFYFEWAVKKFLKKCNPCHFFHEDLRN